MRDLLQPSRLRRVAKWVSALLFLLMGTQCVGYGEGSGVASGADSQKSAPPTFIPLAAPTIEVWDVGIRGLIKPYLLFAAWEDGTVLRRNGRRDVDGLSIGRGRAVNRTCQCQTD